MPMREGGVTPVSVYVIDDRGKCKVATGCYYENRDDQNIFVGAGTMGCVTSFNVSTCKSNYSCAVLLQLLPLFWL